MLILLAAEALNSSPILKENDTVDDSYNGLVAAFGVSVAMTGLRASLAIYYHKAERRDILEILTKMLLSYTSDCSYRFRNDVKKNGITINVSNAESLLRYTFYSPIDEVKKLQKEIIDCSVALKQVIRTYKLVKKDD